LSAGGGLRSIAHSDNERRADFTSNTYWDWVISQPYLIFSAQTEVAKFLSTFKEYPPAQRAASFSVDQIIENMQKNLSLPSND
jgi:arylsulfatase